MSVTSVGSNLLSQLYSSGGAQSTQNNQSNFQQIQAEFQQLGQDLQSGNLTQAQQDFATLSQNFPAAQQAGASASTNANNASPLAQAFSTLSQALQSGNLSAAQSAFATVQQDVQQRASQPHGHHHRHGGGGGGGQDNQAVQAFDSLSQALQSGNLSAAQTAFASLQQDIQEGPLAAYGASNGTTTGASTSGSSLNVTA